MCQEEWGVWRDKVTDRNVGEGCLYWLVLLSAEHFSTPQLFTLQRSLYAWGWVLCTAQAKTTPCANRTRRCRGP